jgi:hypothetical protein
MATIIEYEVVTKVTRDNQDYLPGSIISLQAKDAAELFKVNAIKLPDTGDGAAATDLVVDDSALRALQDQLTAALADRDVLVLKLDDAQQSLQTAAASLAAAVNVETELKTSNQALTDQLIQAQQQLAAAEASAADTSAPTSTKAGKSAKA